MSLLNEEEAAASVGGGDVGAPLNPREARFRDELGSLAKSIKIRRDKDDISSSSDAASSAAAAALKKQFLKSIRPPKKGEIFRASTTPVTPISMAKIYEDNPVRYDGGNGPVKTGNDDSKNPGNVKFQQQYKKCADAAEFSVGENDSSGGNKFECEYLQNRIYQECFDKNSGIFGGGVERKLKIAADLFSMYSNQCPRTKTRSIDDTGFTYVIEDEKTLKRICRISSSNKEGGVNEATEEEESKSDDDDICKPTPAIDARFPASRYPIWAVGGLKWFDLKNGTKLKRENNLDYRISRERILKECAERAKENEMAVIEAHSKTSHQNVNFKMPQTFSELIVLILTILLIFLYIFVIFNKASGGVNYTTPTTNANIAAITNTSHSVMPITYNATTDTTTNTTNIILPAVHSNITDITNISNSTKILPTCAPICKSQPQYPMIGPNMCSVNDDKAICGKQPTCTPPPLSPCEPMCVDSDLICDQELKELYQEIEKLNFENNLETLEESDRLKTMIDEMLDLGIPAKTIKFIHKAINLSNWSEDDTKLLMESNKIRYRIARDYIAGFSDTFFLDLGENAEQKIKNYYDSSVNKGFYGSLYKMWWNNENFGKIKILVLEYDGELQKKMSTQNPSILDVYKINVKKTYDINYGVRKYEFLKIDEIFDKNDPEVVQFNKILSLLDVNGIYNKYKNDKTIDITEKYVISEETKNKFDSSKCIYPGKDLSANYPIKPPKEKNEKMEEQESTDAINID